MCLVLPDTPAIARADLVTLMSVWADDEDIVCIHPTGQRLSEPHVLPPDRKLVEARRSDDRLQLSFSDGYRGTFDVEWVDA